MDLLPFFKSLIDQDLAPVVICDTGHTVVYMNPAAVEEYSDDGGSFGSDGMSWTAIPRGRAR